MPNESAFRKSLALLLSRRFGTFWFACLLSNIGTWAQQVAQPWLLLSLGASPFLLGLDSFALAAPVFLLTLVGGAIADQQDKRRTIVMFQSVQMLCPVIIVVLLLLGHIEPWMVIALSLVVGVTDGLSMPSFQSIVPSIVEKKSIPTGIALNSTQFNLSRILGPAIAGALMASVGTAGAFAGSAASYVPFILVAIWVLPSTLVVAGRSKSIDWRQIIHNVGAILHQPSLRGALITVLLGSLLCAPLVVFAPLLVKEAFHGDITHFSLAVSAFGAGGLLGAVGLLGVDEQRDRRALSSGFAICYGVILVMTGVTTSVWGMSILFFLAGVAMTVSNTSSNSHLQAAAAGDARGQTVSLFMLAMRGGMGLGSLLTGLSVTYFGVREALLINGVLAILLQLLVAWQWLRQKP
jgi:predicted MFS family arabinose efflux permease